MKFGGKLTMFAGQTLVAILTILTPVLTTAGDFPVLVVLRVLTGIGQVRSLRFGDFVFATRTTVRGRGSRSDRPRLTSIYNLDLQFQASYGHEPKDTNSGSIGSKGSVETNGQTDGQTDITDCLTFPACAVGRSDSISMQDAGQS